MKFMHVTISAKNLDESVAFYRDIVGLPVTRRYAAGPDTEIAFLGDGETQVELIYTKNKPDVAIGQDISIGFATDSVERLIEELRAKGVPLISDIISPNPHVAFFFVADPNGVKVQFLESK
jgi:lactoylglutathione lyase